MAIRSTTRWVAAVSACAAAVISLGTLPAGSAAQGGPAKVSAAKFLSTFCDDTPIRSNLLVTAGVASIPTHCDVNIANMGVTLTIGRGAKLTVDGNMSLSAADNRAADSVFVMEGGSSLTGAKVILHSRLGTVRLGAAKIVATSLNIFVGSRGATTVDGGATLTSTNGRVRISAGTTVVKAGAKLTGGTQVQVYGDNSCVATGVVSIAPSVRVCPM